MQYLIKLSPEITIKSDGVRKLCIKKLKRNIGLHLDDAQVDYNISGNWDRIILEVSELEKQEEIIALLQRVAGIGYFTPIEEIELEENLTQEEIFDALAEAALEKYKNILEEKSFVVRVKRCGRHTFKSLDAERQVGGRILQSGVPKRVSLDTPDVTIKYDIKDTHFYLMGEKYIGMGGYPVGFQGRVLSLISGGFDSTVSTQTLMKRGCEVDYLFFNLGGNAHELGVRQVSHYLWKHFSVSYKRARFISIPFDEVISQLLTEVDHSLRGVLLKRYMLKVASMIAERHYDAIVKGDSLGQVSSQTLKNMSVIDEAASVLTLRPLIAMNKQEIIDISKKIGTYEFAKSMPEYCGIISDKPSVGVSKEDILKQEANLDEDILERALDNRTIISLSKILDESSPEDISEISEVSNELVIDIRESSRVEKSPLSHKGITVEVLTIPFFEINEKFPKLDQSKNYAFYCDKGVLSHLHGLYLGEKGFKNISVFRPMKK